MIDTSHIERVEKAAEPHNLRKKKEKNWKYRKASDIIGTIYFTAEEYILAEK